MAMYSYRSIKRVLDGVEKYEAPDELYVNGKTLTSLFNEGVYRQLTVTGRGLKEFNVNSTGYLNRSGKSINSITVEPLEFTIKYMINTKNSEELRSVLDTLQSELSGRLTIKFKDDMNYEYRDVVMDGVSRNVEDSYKLVGEFTLTAYNPFRIGTELITSDVVEIQVPSVQVQKISVSFAENIDSPAIELYDGKYWHDFTINTSVTSGDTFIMSVDEDTGIVELGGNISSEHVNLGDLPRETEVFNGAKGRVKDSWMSEVKITYRDVRL